MNSKIYIHKKYLTHNVLTIKQRLHTGVKIIAVIKDNAYGHGFDLVAHSLSSYVDWFCVARVEEGVRLRHIGIKQPILVLEIPTIETSVLYPNFNLTATLASLQSIEFLASGTEFHINIDTGMRRLGILPEDISELVHKLTLRTDIKATGIYTHFSKSDDPGNSEVEAQLTMFKEIRASFDSALLTHTANTGAVFHYPELEHQFDAVRPGISLFGYGSGKTLIKDLKPVIEWKTNLVKVDKIKSGQPVSYGGRWEAPKDGYIGVIPVGYGSGIPRSLSNKLKVYVNDQAYSQVGAITMDYSMIFFKNDVFRISDEVTLSSYSYPNLANWSKITNMIIYELLTYINPNIQRQLIKK